MSDILPLLRNVVHSCIDASYMTKPEPMQSWSYLALIDCLMTLDGLLVVLPTDVVIKELIEVWDLMITFHLNLPLSRTEI